VSLHLKPIGDRRESLVAGILRRRLSLSATYAHEIAREILLSIRKPTAAMLDAGCAAHPPEGYNRETTLTAIIEAEWTAMVDEMLK
jgi:hypothetical protein